MNTETWLQKCVEKTEAAPVDEQTRGTLFFALSTLGSITHDLTFLQKLISEEMMQESPFIEYLMQKYSEQGKAEGIEQGLREMSIKNTLSVLTERFPGSDVRPVEPVLKSILDIERLAALHRRAVQTPSVEVFLQELNGSET